MSLVTASGAALAVLLLLYLFAALLTPERFQ